MRRNTLTRNPDGTPKSQKLSQLQLLMASKKNSSPVNNSQIKVSTPVIRDHVNQNITVEPILETKEKETSPKPIDTNIPLILNIEQLDTHLLNNIKSYIDLSKNTEERIVMLSSKRESITEHIERLKRHKTSLEDKSNSLKEKLSELKQSLSSKEVQIIELEKHISIFSGLKLKVNDVNSNDSKEIIQKLEELESKESSKKGDLKEDVNKISEKIGSLRGEIITIDHELSEIKSQISSKTEDVNKYESTISKLGNPELYSLSAQTIDDLDNIKIVCETFRILPDLASDIKIKTRELESFLSELKQKEELISKLSSEKESLSSIDILKEQYDKSEKDLSDKKSELDSKRIELDELDQKLKVFSEKISSLATDLKDKNKNINDYISMLEEKKSFLEEIENKL